MPEPSESRDLMRALPAWARTTPHGWRIGGLNGGCYDMIQLHHRPDPLGPEVTVTLRATMLEGRRVIEAVLSAHPAGLPSTTTPDISLVDLSLAGTGLPARDPAVRCDGCGTIGTVCLCLWSWTTANRPRPGLQ